MVATMYDLWVQHATDYDAPLIVSHTREGNDTEDSPLLGSEYQPIITHDEVDVVHPAVGRYTDTIMTYTFFERLRFYTK